MSLSGKTIGIIGLGQMGGSLAAALTRLQTAATILGYDRKQLLLREAMRRRIVTDTATSIGDLIERSDIVIVATPVSAIIKILSKNCRSLSEKLLVVDLGSIRQPIQLATRSVGLTNHIGMHFLCGTSLQGVASWNETLFDRARCFLFAPNQPDQKALRSAKHLARVLNARPILIDPRTHDDLFAITSGLPHLFASSLVKLWRESGGPDLRGPSFESATRVASSDHEMVSEMLFHNRRSILKAMSRLESNLDRFRSALKQNDPRFLERHLKNCIGSQSTRASNGNRKRSRVS